MSELVEIETGVQWMDLSKIIWMMMDTWGKATLELRIYVMDKTECYRITNKKGEVDIVARALEIILKHRRLNQLDDRTWMDASKVEHVNLRKIDDKFHLCIFFTRRTDCFELTCKEYDYDLAIKVARKLQSMRKISELLS